MCGYHHGITLIDQEYYMVSKRYCEYYMHRIAKVATIASCAKCHKLVLESLSLTLHCSLCFS